MLMSFIDVKRGRCRPNDQESQLPKSPVKCRVSHRTVVLSHALRKIPHKMARAWWADSAAFLLPPNTDPHANAVGTNRNLGTLQLPFVSPSSVVSDPLPLVIEEP